MPLFTNTLQTFHKSIVGGRLKFLAQNWSSITEDTWALRTLGEGLRLDFVDPLFQSHLLWEICKSAEMK